jgi:hypothetical protein
MTTAIHKHVLKQAHGRAAEKELYELLNRANKESAQRQEEARQSVIDLRAENARRRLQDQSELDADYRNYLIPV